MGEALLCRRSSDKDVEKIMNSTEYLFNAVSFGDLSNSVYYYFMPDIDDQSLAGKKCDIFLTIAAANEGVVPATFSFQETNLCDLKRLEVCTNISGSGNSLPSDPTYDESWKTPSTPGDGIVTLRTNRCLLLNVPIRGVGRTTTYECYQDNDTPPSINIPYLKIASDGAHLGKKHIEAFVFNIH